MFISMALFSPPISSSLRNPKLIPKIPFSLLSTKCFSLVSVTRASSNNGTISPATASVSATTVEIPKSASVAVKDDPVKSPAESSSASENGVVGGEKSDSTTTATIIKFEDAKWVNGTWDLKKFEKDGKTDWDSIIVAGFCFFEEGKSLVGL